jgi:hypothetical protein
MAHLKQRGVTITEKKKNGITIIEVETKAMDDLMYHNSTLDSEYSNQIKNQLTGMFKGFGDSY